LKPPEGQPPLAPPAAKARNQAGIDAAYSKRESVLQSTPRIIQLEHTSVCKLQCLGCPHFAQRGRLGIELDWAVVEKLEPILPAVEQIHLSGGGEPFIAQHLEDALEVYARHQIRVTTTTNLIYISDRAIELIEACFFKINVSCDGATRETFEGIRRNASFSVFCENVARVRATRPDLQLIMGYTLYRQNIHELPDAVSLAKSLGFDQMVVTRMIPRPAALPHTVRDSVLRYPRETNRMLREARARAEEIGMPLVLPAALPEQEASGSLSEERAAIEAPPRFPSDAEADRLADKWWSRWGDEKDLLSKPRPVRGASIEPPGPPVSSEGACEWLFENTFINANGDVGTCSLMPTNSLGNVLQVDSFEDIWNGPDLVALRKRFWQGAVPHHCYGCQALMHGYLHRAKLTQEVVESEFHSTRFDPPEGGSGVSLKNP
jgi:MoaA/NifB/PqqE/SkfB family radical SAM enzyme